MPVHVNGYVIFWELPKEIVNAMASKFKKQLDEREKKKQIKKDKHFEFRFVPKKKFYWPVEMVIYNAKGSSNKHQERAIVVDPTSETDDAFKSDLEMSPSNRRKFKEIFKRTWKENGKSGDEYRG